MNQDQRALHQTTDISVAVNDFRSGNYVFPYVVGEYLYIGSVFPFNNLWFDMGVPNYTNVYEVQTLTFPALVGAGASDYIVIYDKTGTAWAVALDTTGADADPTGAAWTAVAGANKIKVDISGATTAIQVAAIAFAGLNSLTGFTTVITLVDNADGTLTSTQKVYGATLNPVPHNADDSGVGSILGVETTPGSIGATVSVNIWFGNNWVPAVDILDGTNGLSTSGRIQWNTDINQGWDNELRSEDVTGLTGTKIYNMFWLRMNWSANMNPLTRIDYMGQKFADDATLYSFYPDLNNQAIRDSFVPLLTPGTKTTWDEQHFMAAEQVVLDLKKRNIAKARSQLLDFDLFKDASCHKVAEICYTAFGLPYFDQTKRAAEQFKKAMDIKNFGVDLNKDGRLDPEEKSEQVGYGTR